MTIRPARTEAAWRRASACSEGSNCVEVAPRAGGMAVRDSKDPDGPVLTFGADAWAAFLGAVRGGEFDEIIAA